MSVLNYGILFYCRLLAQSGHFHDDLFAPSDASNGWAKPRIVVEEDLCIGCGACAHVCPSCSIRAWDNIAHVANPAACVTCLTLPCIPVCPTVAFVALASDA